MLAVKTENLTKKYKDVVAVNNLNLEINKGEVFSLLGVNGAGKTTTVKMLCCLLKSTGGNAYLMGKNINSEPLAVKEIIGISPQETAVAMGLTVKENLELMCGVYGLFGKKRQQKINQLSNQFNLNDILNKKAAKLSGGWQRRLSIALALVGEPQILFLDEPTLGLDVIARSELWDIIRGLQGKATVILTTHYMEEAEALSTRVGIMKNGNLIDVGTPTELKEKAQEQTFEKAFIKIVKGAE